MVKKSLLSILFLVSGFVLLGATNNTQKMQSRDFPSVDKVELKQPGALLITYAASWNTDDVTAKAGTLIANSTISVMSDSGSTIATLRIYPHGSTNPNTNPSGSFLPADYTSPPYKHGAAYANVVGVWEVNGLSPGTYLVAHRNQSRWVDGLEGTLCEMSTSVDVKTRETPTPPPPSSYSLSISFPLRGEGTVAIEGESLSSPNGKTFSFSPGKSITMMATVGEQSNWGGYSGSHSGNNKGSPKISFH